MKLWKILGALVVVAALSSAAFASAAKLNLNSQGAQAGNALVPSCQISTVNTSYGTSYLLPIFGSQSGYFLTSATASNLNAACLNHTIKVVLTFTGFTGCNPTCFLDLGTKPITGPSVTFSPIVYGGFLIKAELLTDIHVAIN